MVASKPKAFLSWEFKLKQVESKNLSLYISLFRICVHKMKPLKRATVSVSVVAQSQQRALIKEANRKSQGERATGGMMSLF